MSSSSAASFFNKVPWTFLIIIYLVGAQVSQIPLDGVPGFILIGLGVFVLFAEFFKSGDIGLAVFMIDMVTSVIALVTATVLLCYLAWEMGQPLTFYHWFGYTILLGDAIFSPLNSFRTALRNFGVGQ
ncbi:hypothetical protein [Candidatus Electronema sp. JM]|uniref:hypothetical protein n=1 Tax=Candidatus Electronema sp. JM TaxID=3401571 RepID=UPI003AA98A84